MKNPFSFFNELQQQPTWISMWLLFLMTVNVASLMFWEEPLAKVIFVTFMISAILMMGLYSWFGFEKILGMGHILWIPLLAYGLIEIPAAEGAFKSYLIILIISIATSLVFDIVDVWKFFTRQKST